MDERFDPRPRDVAERREVGREDEDDEEEPARVLMHVDDDRRDGDCEALEMEEDAWNAHGRPKARDAFSSIVRSRASTSTPRASASAASVWTTYAGSFGFPRTSCGARYGVSVSARRRSSGTCSAAQRSSRAFGNVTLPAKERYQPRSSAAARRPTDEKQWRTTVRPF